MLLPPPPRRRRLLLLVISACAIFSASPVQGQNRTCYCWTDQDCINQGGDSCANSCAYDFWFGHFTCMDWDGKTMRLRPGGRVVGVPVPVPAPVPVPFPVPFPVPVAPVPSAPTLAPAPVPTPPRVLPTLAPAPTPPVVLPTMVPAPVPTPPTVPPAPDVIPSVCQVDFLVNLMDRTLGMEMNIAAQWLRLAFHDAGTFNLQDGQGGANGCLLTNPTMRTTFGNENLDMAIDPLLMVQSTMATASPDVAIRLTSADLIQFAGFFVAVRQRGTPGLDDAKRQLLRDNFQWGRPDEASCNTATVENLPDFRNLNAAETDVPQRCSFAGRNIQQRMIERNGFTAREATVLIGAHTIGLTRRIFGDDLADPWVENGADDATPNGPVFDNAYHAFLVQNIPANSAAEFGAQRDPFDQDFPNWFKSNTNNLNHLDTDIVLAFPSVDTAMHPHFDSFTREFAASNDVFITSFMAALDKMSKLGVTAPLASAHPCVAVAPPTGSGVGTAPVAAPTPDFMGSMGDAIATARNRLDQTLVARQDEINTLTTPVGG